MKISMISAGDKAPSGLLPIFTMEGNVKFYLQVNKNKEATFSPKVHMLPYPRLLTVESLGSTEPQLKTLSLGDRRTR